jgi:Pyruvate/2-oxoacid:ferredoxin oxidoreductase delta subunit
METDENYPQCICEGCFDRFISFNQFLQFAVACQKEIKELVEGNNIKLVLDDYRKNNSSCSEIDLFEDIEVEESETKPTTNEQGNIKNKIEIKQNPDNPPISENDFQTLAFVNEEEGEDINDLCEEIQINDQSDNESVMSIHFESSNDEEEVESIQEEISSSSNVTQNIQKVYPNLINVMKVRCPICERFFFQHEMEAHRKIHFPTHQPLVLKQNLRKIAEEKGLRCKICGTEFASEKNKRRHMVEVHEVDYQTCDICGSVFNNIIKLKRHKSRQHKENPPCCPIQGCEYTNPRKVHLHRHLFTSSHYLNISLNTKEFYWEEMCKLYGFYEIRKKN